MSGIEKNVKNTLDDLKSHVKDVTGQVKGALFVDNPVVAEQKNTNWCSRYFQQVKKVKSFDEFMGLNKRSFGYPLLGIDQFATGAAFGFASGFFIQRAAKVGAVLVGVSFLSLQVLSYYGYLHLNWDKCGHEMQRYMDANKDEINKNTNKFQRMVTWGLPGGCGFGTGFLFGLRW